MLDAVLHATSVDVQIRQASRIIGAMRRLLAVALCLAAACKSHGQLVLGIATDQSAREQLDHVTLAVTRRGDSTPTVQHVWELSGLPAKDYRLPGSFALYANPGQEPTFDVEITGTLAGARKVRRLATLGIVAKSERFIRLGLTGSCATLGCPDSLSCVEGACVPRFIAPKRMPRFEKAFVDHLQCDSGTAYTDTSTHVLLPILGSCDSNQSCSEGVCLLEPSALSGADPVPLTGGLEELYSPVGTGFFPVGPLDAPRYFATSTPLSDGRVLVVGGFPSPVLDDSVPAVEGASIYDPGAAASRRIASPPDALGGHTATLLADGTVLFVGCAAGGPSAFLFAPATETFTSLPSPPSARSFHSASRLVDGRVLLVGGINGASVNAAVDRYDPSTRTFSTLSKTTSAPRAYHQATALLDGRVLLSGGTTSDGSVLSTYEYYQPATDDFSAPVITDFPRALHTAVRLADGNVLLVGGFNKPLASRGAATADAQIVGTGSSPGTVLPAAPLPRAAQQAATLPTGEILFVAGASVSSLELAPAGGAFAYEPSTQTFRRLSDPAAARVGAFATALAGHPADILIGGGNGMAIFGDGGVPDGGSDMSSSACNPVGPASGCAQNEVCTIAGTETFGPRMTSGAARCVTSKPAAGVSCTVNIGVASNTVDCAQGSVCLTDIADNAPHCQTLCRSDGDCASGQRTRCALLLAGSDVGVCMPPCAYAVGNGAGDCAVFNGTDASVKPQVTCHFEPTVAKAAGPVALDGICRYDGKHFNGNSCDESLEGTACSAGTYCAGPAKQQTCDIMCTAATAMQCQLACTNPVPTSTNGNGYCQ